MIDPIINNPGCQLSTFNIQYLTINQLLDLLPDNGQLYQSQLTKFTADHRKREWLAVRVLLYKMIGETKEICYKESGKPYLADKSYHISISHTRGYVAVMISKTNRVGIDIEVLSQRALKVAHKFVDETELIYPPTDKITHSEILTLIWSAKETMYKCMDSREILFREELHVDVNIPLLEQPYFYAYENHTPRRQSFKIHYLLEPGEYVLTYCL